jgi:hypothetical protein
MGDVSTAWAVAEANTMKIARTIDFMSSPLFVGDVRIIEWRFQKKNRL